MGDNQFRNDFKILICVMTLFPLVIPARANAEEVHAKQVITMGKIAEGILTCTVHPCLGDSDESVQGELPGTILSDEISYYSDLETAFPSAQGVVGGIVEWDVESTLEMVSLKVTSFRDKPEDLLAELERALPGCEMERDDDYESEGEEDDSEDHHTRAWSCLAEGYGSKDVLVGVYFIPSLLLLEIGS